MLLFIFRVLGGACSEGQPEKKAEDEEIEKKGEAIGRREKDREEREGNEKEGEVREKKRGKK